MNFFQVFGLIKSTGFSNVTPCSPIGIYGLFGGTYCVMRVVTILHGYHTTRRHAPEDSVVHGYCCENLQVLWCRFVLPHIKAAMNKNRVVIELVL